MEENNISDKWSEVLSDKPDSPSSKKAKVKKLCKDKLFLFSPSNNYQHKHEPVNSRNIIVYGVAFCAFMYLMFWSIQTTFTDSTQQISGYLVVSVTFLDFVNLIFPVLFIGHKVFRLYKWREEDGQWGNGRFFAILTSAFMKYFFILIVFTLILLFKFYDITDLWRGEALLSEEPEFFLVLVMDAIAIQWAFNLKDRTCKKCLENSLGGNGD